MTGKQKILVSGIQPTGALHIGNYFGALRQFVELQHEYSTHIFVADYHALTTVHDRETLSHNILNTAIDYLAVGLDPKKVTLYQQSAIPELAELTWIFNTLITVPYLSRAHAYKDAMVAGKEPTVGLFDYPVLMAADILLPGADIVPVGSDQKQHVEMARDIAGKFNAAFGETFTLPTAMTLDNAGVVLGTDGRKMSKSYNNTILLFSSREDIQKAVMGIVTDSEGGRPENVWALHTLLKSEEELTSLYTEHEGNYKALKEALIEDIDAFIAPLRERRATIAGDEGAVYTILADGAARVHQETDRRMELIRKRVGLA